MKKESIGDKLTDVIEWVEENWIRLIIIIMIAGIVISNFKENILALF